MKDLGPYDRHQCLVVHPENASQYAEGVADAARECFKDVDVFQTRNHKDGWPSGPNYQFQNAAYHVYENPKYVGSFYFFEADNTPQHPGWLDKLEEEYNLSGKAYMGAVVPTRAKQGGQEIEYGAHLVGTGIYPKDAAKRSHLLGTLRSQIVPWDLYLQWEIVPHCHATDSIQHIWNVHCCKRRGTSIVCQPNHDLSQPVPIRKGALVVHGVKDGSLMRLLREKEE